MSRCQAPARRPTTSWHDLTRQASAVALLAAAAAAGFAACSGPSRENRSASAPQVDLAALQDAIWEVQSVEVDEETVPMPANESVSFVFQRDGGSFRVEVDACNLVTGTLDGWPDRFAVTEVGWSERECDDPALMTMEEVLIRALPAVDRVRGGTDDIVLTGPGVVVTLHAWARPSPAAE